MTNSDTSSSSRMTTLNNNFSRMAQVFAGWAGHPMAFLLAILVVVVWAGLGPIFNYSDTWQLVINTGTTIVTFLMVFLIQNTQNRDILTVQLKLSELVLAMRGAENKFAALEDLSDEELHSLHEQCRERVEMTSSHIETRKSKKESAAEQSNPPPKRARKNGASRTKH
jgi:low affinity Fe/Cu permease